jgi:hypothetical protein
MWDMGGTWRVGEIGILVRKPERKNIFERSRRRWSKLKWIPIYFRDHSPSLRN